MESIVIERTYNGIQHAVENAFQTLEISLEPDRPVIIKPNLNCIKTCETGATTDPRLVETIVQYLRKHYGVRQFYIVESDATALNANIAFQLLGYNELARKLNINVVNLSRIPYEKRRFPQNLNVSLIKVPKIFRKPHFLISVAKMKTHDQCHFTSTLKNVYGCNPEPYKKRYHGKLHENIVDFASAFKPHISIVDAMIAMEGNGPANGIPIKLNTLIFGKDPLATDYVVAEIMGINSNKVKYLKLGKKQQLGTARCDVDRTVLREIQRKFKVGSSFTTKLERQIGSLLGSVRHIYARS